MSRVRLSRSENDATDLSARLSVCLTLLDDKKISSFRGGVSCRDRGQLLAFLTTQMLCKSAVLKKQNLYSKETQPEISASWISISVFFLFFFCLYCVLSPTGLTNEVTILLVQNRVRAA